MTKSRYFEDFTLGDRFETVAMTVTEAEILGFALKYDPQYFHLDAARAADGPFGGLIASGFQTLSLSFSLFLRQGWVEEANLGSPGLDATRWLRPLRPGDTIRVTATVTELKPSVSKPDRGIVRMLHETWNQHQAVIMTVDCMHMLRRRPDSAG
ncbi:MaoC family dehydratase [Oceanibacterium hippocampi]|uniref:Bifunctional protein PaaZ n=1 Tax=Oceanibacterium hippocampi TaxID=745714 RepID=A0A1Y5TV90_9PROT|nr:MaoC family dehydratase [Oceanibacterium hippocampi]SLN73604.1 Bifunctional protein PaaZ [Oceanibacterium hippocampi]